MGIFIRKPLDLLQAEAQESGKNSLRRVLGPIGLIAFGVGVIIGAGLFSITGTVAAQYTVTSQLCPCSLEHLLS